VLQAEALFLHRVSRVWPPCDLDHPEAGPAVAWLPWTSRLLQLSEGLPRTDAHRLPIGGEGGGGWAGLWHTRPGPVCEPPPGGGTWVLHLHGNGEARCWAKTVRRTAVLLAAPNPNLNPNPNPNPNPKQARKTALLAAPPFCAHVVSIDYRGFADTPSASGAPSAASLLADALAALDWVHRAAGGSAPVVVYGHSLGSHVALAAAAHRCGRGGDSGGGGGGGGGGSCGGGSGGIAAVVLEGAFTGPAEVARSLVPAPLRAVLDTPLRWLYTRELALDSTRAAAALSPALPVFQCHGAHDATVPLRLADALHRALEVGARWRPLETVAGGGHDVLEEPQVLRALEVFWRSNGLSRGAYRVAGTPRGTPRGLRFR
jgi:pimeloyl-ACP methyl ester carboxylesterase